MGRGYATVCLDEPWVAEVVKVLPRPVGGCLCICLLWHAAISASHYLANVSITAGLIVSNSPSLALTLQGFLLYLPLL